MNLKERFDSTLLATEREGMEKLITFLEGTDFYKAPASTQYHASYPGGLLEHSVNVMEELITLSNSLNFKVGNLKKGTLQIVSLLHDICKIDCYKKYQRNVKNSAGQWIKQDAYMWNNERVTYGHGAESVALVGRFVELTHEEAFAIRYHMGAYQEGDMKALSNVYKKYPLAMYLHFADVISNKNED